MNMWLGKNKQTGTIRVAPSDAKLREKILQASIDNPGDWAITQGSTPTDQTRIYEIIEGGDPIQRVLSEATYYVEDDKVCKRRENGR